MRKLFELNRDDIKDLNEVSKRTAVRGIIYDKPYIYLIQSEKYKEFKFPGGGQRINEDHITTLKREVLEEAGIIIHDDIALYGYAIEQRKSSKFKNTICYMTSYYYICSIASSGHNQSLDSYEQAYGYTLKKVHIDEAIKQNEHLLDCYPNDIPWVNREYLVLIMIKDEL